MYLNLYIPSNLNRIKKVKVASLQTMRPFLVKLTALSGISPFTTNVCIDYALPVQLHALTDLVELLDRIIFGWSHWWHGNLSLLSPYFMIKSQLYFLVRPNPHEAYIMSSFFFLIEPCSFFLYPFFFPLVSSRVAQLFVFSDLEQTPMCKVCCTIKKKIIK